jgi:hypothetical protein
MFINMTFNTNNLLNTVLYYLIQNVAAKWTTEGNVFSVIAHGGQPCSV